MSLNKVLNRPLFRQQALKKGALKPIKARIGQMIGPPTVNVTGQMQRNFPVAINQQGFFGRNIRPAMQRTGRFLKSSFGIRPLISSTGTYMLSDDILTKLGVTGPLKTGINFAAGIAGATPYGRGIGYAYSGLKGLSALADKIRRDNPQSFIGLDEGQNTFDQITGGVLGGDPLLTGDRAINPFRKLDPSRPRGRGAIARAKEERARQAVAEGSEVGIAPDQLTKPENSIVVDKKPISDLNEIVSNTVRNKRGDVLEPTVPAQTVAQVTEPSKIPDDGSLTGPVGIEGKDLSIKPEAPVKENKKAENDLVKQAAAMAAGKAPGTDPIFSLARKYFDELQQGQTSQAQTVFLSTLAAGLMQGTTRKKGIGGALEVLGASLGPAVSNMVAVKLKEGEIRAKNREASLNAALDHVKILNTGATSPDRTAGVIQIRTPDGELRNVGGFQLKDGSIQRPVIDENGRQAFETIPQGGPIKNAQGDTIGVVQQFRAQKDIGKRLFDIEDVLGNRYTAYSTTLDVLKTLNRLTPEGESVKAGAALTVDAFLRRTTGVARELLGIEIGDTRKEAEQKLQEYYDDEVAAIERDPDLSPEQKKKEISELLNKDSLIKEAKKRLKKNTGWYSGLTRDEQEKLAVQEVSLIYALANTFKDQDRLTQRDINAAREIVNIFSLSRSSKDVKASIEAIGRQLEADILRQERLYTSAGGLYGTILDLRQLKNFNPATLGGITPALEKAFTDDQIRDTLEGVNL